MIKTQGMKKFHIFLLKFEFRGGILEPLDVVILAAGDGSRMGNIVGDIPKSLIPLNGIPIIDFILRNLLYLNIERIIFVVGHQKDKLITYLEENYSREIEISFIANNQIHRENGYSLFCTKDSIKGDHFLLLMADHVIETEIYALIYDGASMGDIILATDGIAGLNDPEEATKVLLEGEKIVAIGKNLDMYSAFDTGVFSMSKTVFPILEQLCQNQVKVSVSDLVTQCIKRNLRVRSCDVSGYFWMDLDTKQDIELISQQLLQDEENISEDEFI